MQRGPTREAPLAGAAPHHYARPMPSGTPPSASPARPGSRDTLIAFLFMGVSITLLPFMNVAAKYLSTDYPTTQILWARYTGHLVFMIAMFMPRHGIGLLRATRPGVHIVRSLLMFVSTVCFFTALRWIPVPTASAINFTGPLIVTALAAPMLGEAVGPRRWAAVAVGFAGAMIIIRPGGADTHWAMLLVLVTAFSYALYQIVTRKTSSVDTPETSITYIAVVGAALSSLVVPFDWVTPDNAIDIGLFCLLGLIGGFAVGMVLVMLFKYRHVKILGRGDLSQTAPPGLVVDNSDLPEPEPEPDQPGPWGPEIKGPWIKTQPRPDTPPRRRSTIPRAGDRKKD